MDLEVCVVVTDRRVLIVDYTRSRITRFRSSYSPATLVTSCPRDAVTVRRFAREYVSTSQYGSSTVPAHLQLQVGHETLKLAARQHDRLAAKVADELSANRANELDIQSRRGRRLLGVAWGVVGVIVIGVLIAVGGGDSSPTRDDASDFTLPDISADPRVLLTSCHQRLCPDCRAVKPARANTCLPRRQISSSTSYRAAAPSGNAQ